MIYGLRGRRVNVLEPLVLTFECDRRVSVLICVVLNHWFSNFYMDYIYGLHNAIHLDLIDYLILLFLATHGSPNEQITFIIIILQRFNG